MTNKVNKEMVKNWEHIVRILSGVKSLGQFNMELVELVDFRDEKWINLKVDNAFNGAFSCCVCHAINDYEACEGEECESLEELYGDKVGNQMHPDVMKVTFESARDLYNAIEEVLPKLEAIMNSKEWTGDDPEWIQYGVGIQKQRFLMVDM